MLQWLAQIEMDSEVIFVGVRDTYVPPPECVVEEDQVEAVRAGSVTNIAVVNHSVTNLQCRHDLMAKREKNEYNPDDTTTTLHQSVSLP